MTIIALLDEITDTDKHQQMSSSEVQFMQLVYRGVPNTLPSQPLESNTTEILTKFRGATCSVRYLDQAPVSSPHHLMYRGGFY